MADNFTSKALEANLIQTRDSDIEIPEEQQWFIDISRDKWGIHKRAEEFIIELNHKFVNYQYVIEVLHNISLNDLWFYNSHEESEKALTVLVHIFQDLIDSDLTEEQRELLIKTIIKFMERLVNLSEFPHSIIWKCLDFLKLDIQVHENLYLFNSGYFKTYFNKIAKYSEYRDCLFQMTAGLLDKCIDYWENTADVEAWLSERNIRFDSLESDKLQEIKKPFFDRLRNELKKCTQWDELYDLMFFNDISNYFRGFTEQFGSSREKIYYLHFLLHLPGMVHLKDHLLYDMNRYLRSVLEELDENNITFFLDKSMVLFEELKTDHAGTVLDCVLTLGKEIIHTKNDSIISYFVKCLIQLGFHYPGQVTMNSEWQIKINANHVKNIKVWMELIEYSPYEMRELLAALIVNLKLGGIFISDTDLFQREVTKLLNSDIAPVYREMKQLARIFPVYFREIGAEGKLREITTAIDEFSRRQDRLIHFLRKQTHTESNNTHIALTRQIILYWVDGDKSRLKSIIPDDVFEWLDVKSEWYLNTNEIMSELCKAAGTEPEELFLFDIERLKQLLAAISDKTDRDGKRVLYLFQIHSLLRDKYSLESEDIINMLKNYHFFTEEEREGLKKQMEANNPEASLVMIYKFMLRLKGIILDPEESVAVEDIYYKRHIAAGIPSMYGQYIEAKFDALGLMFRLEKTASKLMVELLQSVNLEYITLKTFRRIYNVLALFKEGLELDGISNQGFNSNIDMFKYSLSSPSFSLDQYINLFQFMAQDIKQIISEYFIDAYERPLADIIPQVFPDYHSLAETDRKQFSQMESEKFFRDNLSSAFLVQDLDNFITNIVNTLRNMVEGYSDEFIHNVMSYDPDLILSPLNAATLEMDNPVFLGAKAYFLKKMISYGLQVPPGFVLTTEVFRHKETVIRHPHMNQELNQNIRNAVSEIEKITSMKFGDPNNPLLFSVRSGSSLSLPGAMKTFLNVGMNDEIAEAFSKKAGYEWTAWDCYRRFFQSWGMFYGIERDIFDEVMKVHKANYGLELKKQFSPKQMKETCYAYEKVLKDKGIHIEKDPFLQLRHSILGVMDSWSTKSAIYYRNHMQIADEWGTAVIVQKMILGNLSQNSGTGVVFTNSPFNGKAGINLFGDFALCSQGEDVVSGLVNTLPITEKQRKQYNSDATFSLESAFPEIYNHLLAIARQLIEKHGYTHQEIEFTFESDKPENLYILQIRNQNLKKQSIISTFVSEPDKMKSVGSGIGISGGALSGILAFDMDDIEDLKVRNPDKKVILVRPDTVPDDIPLIFNCDGLITAKGGATSHAAVTAASLGKVCIVSCKSLKVNDDEKTCTFRGGSFSLGDEISIDGNSGFIYEGAYEASDD
ncbi:MAG: PEP/pyruvate-binding domain-containing protein [Eubacteriales bacterium]|nr:PEP/pyruvate-binding domain-containing protein [Eubacteriales bacterium]MDD3199043.1 PEP/pyruvate-binding domain-containing protein [Eubacteriales bacterium]MDD4629471.1 PEP/pyruvate-binding domain-containing protein [Eubacteriales bacterium]